ncbi:MAG: BON domain-containing protein [Polyangiaceae bacterium]
MLVAGLVVACGNDERPPSDPTRAMLEGTESDAPETEAVVTRTPTWAKPTKVPEAVVPDPAIGKLPPSVAVGDADHTIVERIRKAVLSDDGLSAGAKGAKVVAVDGTVTLRGTVRSSAERTAMEITAKNVAGVNRVDNQLEIAIAP